MTSSGSRYGSSSKIEPSAVVEVGDSRLLLYKSTYQRGENTVASFLVKDVEGIVSDLRGRGVSFEDYDHPGLKTSERRSP